MEATHLSIHKPAAEAQPADLVTITFPTVLLTWKTLSGEPLSGEAFKAAILLWDRVEGEPRAIEINLTEFGVRMNVSSSSAVRRINALQAERLVKVLKRRRGPNGGQLVYVFDPRRIWNRRFGAVLPDPQRALVFEQEMIAASCETIDALIETKQVKPDPPAQQGSDTAGADETGGTGGRVAGTVDVLNALQASLQSDLGDERYQLWLQPCRFLLDGSGLTIVAPKKVVCDRLRSDYRAAIEAAAIEELGEGLNVHITFEERPPSVVLCRTDGRGPGRLVVKQFHGTENGTVESGTENGTVELRNQPTQINQTNQTNQPNRAREDFSPARPTVPLAAAAERLVARALACYESIGDDGLYPFFAFAAVLAVDERTITQEQLLALIADDPYEFAERLKKALQGRSSLFHYRCVKTALHKRGVKWKREWDKSRRQRVQDSERRDRERRQPR